MAPWRLCNDKDVTLVQYADIKTKILRSCNDSAYMLFYRQLDGDAVPPCTSLPAEAVRCVGCVLLLRQNVPCVLMSESIHRGTVRCQRCTRSVVEDNTKGVSEFEVRNGMPCGRRPPDTHHHVARTLNAQALTGATFRDKLSANIARRLSSVPGDKLYCPERAVLPQIAPAAAGLPDELLPFVATYSDQCDVTLCAKDVEVTAALLHLFSVCVCARVRLLCGACGRSSKP